MKATRNILIGLILGAVIGWALGFLRLPYIEKNLSYLVGFISCFAFISLLLILVFVWKKNSQLLKLMDKNSVIENINKPARTLTLIWIAIAVFILAGGLVSSFLIHSQTEFFEKQIQNQNKIIKEQSELIESSRRSSMLILLNDVLEKVDADLKNNPTGTLSDKTIASIIVAFNYTFIPYRYWEGDSSSKKKLSPEKGQLLLELFKRNIDSTSFNKIKLNAHFSGADLRKEDLHGVNLYGADLKDADLSNADLTGAIFIGADLRNANLFGVHANKANFFSADMRRAVLIWSELNGARLDSANLNGADLSNAQLRKVDMHGARLRAAKLNGALLNEANLEGAELVDANLTRTNLTKVNLKGAYIFGAKFKEAIMTEAELSYAIAQKDWFKNLNEWHITGTTEIQENYKLVLDTAFKDFARYLLEKN